MVTTPMQYDTHIHKMYRQVTKMHQSNIIMPCTKALNNNDLCFISIVNTTGPARVEEGLETSHKNLQAKNYSPKPVLCRNPFQNL